MQALVVRQGRAALTRWKRLLCFAVWGEVVAVFMLFVGNLWSFVQLLRELNQDLPGISTREIISSQIWGPAIGALFLTILVAAALVLRRRWPDQRLGWGGHVLLAAAAGISLLLFLVSLVSLASSETRNQTAMGLLMLLACSCFMVALLATAAASLRSLRPGRASPPTRPPYVA
jgi:hypothetical protein